MFDLKNSNTSIESLKFTKKKLAQNSQKLLNYSVIDFIRIDF